MKPERDLVLVTGAAGWIGRNVCSALNRAGCRVAAFDLVKPGIRCDEIFVGSLAAFADPTAELCQLLGRTSAVIHCAGRAHRPIETPEEVALFEETNVGGTRSLLAACEACGVRRMVYVSTIAGYDWTTMPAGGHGEQAIQKPTSAYARTKLEGERLVRESTLDWRVVRLATVFGAGDRANFAKLAGALRRKQFVVPGRGDARKSVIPVDLAAEVLMQLAQIEEPKHRLVNVALPEPPTLRAICDAFSAGCGFPRARGVSLPLLRCAARLGDLLAKAKPGFPLTTGNLRKLTTPTVVDASRLYETLPTMRWPTFAECLNSAAAYYNTIDRTGV
ncbi:MAG: NAD(P)-dependent oxidoreductase [Opitutaceae bacterium]